jgi:O-Antigen ligase
MNKILLLVLAVLFPFYPLLAYAFHFVNSKPMMFYLNLLMLPVALYYLVNSRRKLPSYLVAFLLFTLYHVGISFYTDTLPKNQNAVFFIFSDPNVFACSLFLLIENTVFDEPYMQRMNRNILIIVGLSLIVSIIQIKDPTFLYDTSIEVEAFVGEGDIRISSLYSFAGVNSGGITFPILIAILLNFYDTSHKLFPLIVIGGLVVTFLTKARYVMISSIISFSQLFFSGRVSMQKIFSLLIGLVVIVAVVVAAANQMGFNINEVIEQRILEKDNEMGSAKARITSYEVFMKKFPEHPWFGVGPATRQDVKDLLGDEAPLIHVGYLSYLYYYGLVGCLFLFLTLFFILRWSWVIGKQYGFWGGFYGFLGFCFANVTFVYFNFAEMGIVLIVIYLHYYSNMESVQQEVETEPVALT